jgi:hypothetical protein
MKFRVLVVALWLAALGIPLALFGKVGFAVATIAAAAILGSIALFIRSKPHLLRMVYGDREASIIANISSGLKFLGLLLLAFPAIAVVLYIIGGSR